jgi:hypothetical protein
VKDDNCDLFADIHNILNTWKHYFSQLQNVHNVSGIRQIEAHTVEPLVLGPSSFDVEIAIAELKKYKSPGSNEILAELIQAGSETLLSAIHKLISSIWNKEEFSDHLGQTGWGGMVWIVLAQYRDKWKVCCESGIDHSGSIKC